MGSRNLVCLIVFLFFNEAYTQSPFGSPLTPEINVATLTKNLKRQIMSITDQVRRLKRDPFSEGGAEEDEDLDEDRFRSGFIPEESPVSDSSKIGAPSKGTLTKDFDRDGGVTTAPTVQWQPESESATRGTVHLVDDRDKGDGDTVTLFKGDTGEYCSRFEEHFSFYCVGDVDRTSPEAIKVLEEFCPSYKKNCPENAKGSGATSLGTWPANPFGKEITINKPATDEAAQSDEPPPNLTKHERYTLYMKRRVPCKPDCDIRVYPHCTPECKCDYIYPTVQKFCNPPPIPLFLQTCRIWYNQCPKYEQYHYASQYIYSKAEKGKVLPGVVPKPVNPYNIPQPTAVVSPARSRSRAAASRSLSPRYDSNHHQFRAEEAPTRRRSSLAEAIAQARQKDQPLDSGVSKDLAAFRRVLHDTYRQKLQREIAAEESAATDREPTHQKEIAKKEARNYGPHSAALIAPPDISTHFQRTQRAKASQGSVPVIPSDAAYGSRDAFKDFDAFTDARGVAHRPRSRSPWSKPGLWEPNPDDPHNRDHANKYYYHPESVTADWLNGQLAWGAHWAVPAAGTGGSDGYSVAHFPSLGHFLNIPDDYD